MPDRLFNIFNSYDLFGKSVPGAVLLVGIGTLLPEYQTGVESITMEWSVLNFIALLLLLLIAGLMLGQGVHTLADNTEKFFRWFGIRMSNTVKYVQVSHPDSTIDLNLLKNQSDPEGVNGKIVKNWRNGTIEWFRRRYWGVYDSFVSHRYLFARSIAWNFDDERETERWEHEEKGDLYQKFAEIYGEIYDTDIRQEKPQDIETAYPLITSRVNMRRTGEYRKFQSIYSFCRSMWVVFLLLTLSYSFIFYGQEFLGIGIFGYEPIAWSVFPSEFWYLIPIFTSISTFLFLDAAGTYKRHFVEYLIADFANAEDIMRRENQSSDQLTLDEF